MSNENQPVVIDGNALMAHAQERDAILDALTDMVRDIAKAHWIGIAAIMRRAPDSSVQISLSVGVDTAGKKPHLTCRLSYSEKFKDEIEQWVEDKAQGTLGLDQE
jgi:hypothetical protein